MAAECCEVEAGVGWEVFLSTYLLVIFSGGCSIHSFFTKYLDSFIISRVASQGL